MGGNREASPRSAAARGITAEYHQSLLSQHREDKGIASKQQQLQRHQNRQPRRPRSSRPSSESAAINRRRDWLRNGDSNRDASKSGLTLPGRKAYGKQGPVQPDYPSLTKSDVEDFEALPIAIRRKYFSTSERLRFAQKSSILKDGSVPFHATTAVAYDKDDDYEDNNYDILLGVSDKSATRNPKRRRGCYSELTGKQPASHGLLYRHQTSSVDSLSLCDIHSKVKRQQLSREQQVILARNLRQSVILDAADEALLKTSHCVTRKEWVGEFTPSAVSSHTNMTSKEQSAKRAESQSTRDSLYDSFRWLDEEDDLDLRLYLDDYHADLREALPNATKDSRPSFRRHLSITKIPFGRQSLSLSRPVTKDASSTPASPASNAAFDPHQHGRRKSRALSLIGSRHVPSESITSIDPFASYYQDPEAREKLRVYLASPHKFDEAIEFGFPSDKTASAANPDQPLRERRRQSRRIHSDDSEKLKTFLSDDKSSTYSGDVSVLDTDSPRTPHTPEKPAVRPHKLRSEPTHGLNPQGNPVQHPAASREMTLRMTLTRPDLRACEGQIYGWQKNTPAVERCSLSSPTPDDPLQELNSGGSGPTKESMNKVFAELDQNMAMQEDRGVMKRIWNRVRRA